MDATWMYVQTHPNCARRASPQRRLSSPCSSDSGRPYCAARKQIAWVWSRCGRCNRLSLAISAGTTEFSGQILQFLRTRRRWKYAQSTSLPSGSSRGAIGELASAAKPLRRGRLRIKPERRLACPAEAHSDMPCGPSASAPCAPAGQPPHGSRSGGWSGRRESNPCSRLGKPLSCH